MTQPERDVEVPIIEPTELRQVHKHRTEESSIGDCFRTTIACLIGADQATDVPHFCEQTIAAGLDDHGGWEDIMAARRWLRDTHGLDLIFIGREQADEIGVAYKLTVKSQRGDWNHSVVGRNGAVIWDPSGADTYTMADAYPDESVGVISMPFDPDPDEQIRRWREAESAKVSP